MPGRRKLRSPPTKIAPRPMVSAATTHSTCARAWLPLNRAPHHITCLRMTYCDNMRTYILAGLTQGAVLVGRGAEGATSAAGVSRGSRRLGQAADLDGRVALVLDDDHLLGELVSQLRDVGD